MSGAEFDIQQRIRIAGAAHGTPLLRNNSGALRDENGRMVRFGLGNDSARLNSAFKSSDLIGIFPVVVLPEHVGRTFGLFFAVEVKKPGWKFNPKNEREVAQANFGQWVRNHGGMFTFATDEKEVWA